MEKLMRWNGTEWVEVTNLTRNEVTTVVGLRKKLEDNLVPIISDIQNLTVDFGECREDLELNTLEKISQLIKI